MSKKNNSKRNSNQQRGAKKEAKSFKELFEQVTEETSKPFLKLGNKIWNVVRPTKLKFAFGIPLLLFSLFLALPLIDEAISGPIETIQKWTGQEEEETEDKYLKLLEQSNKDKDIIIEQENELEEVKEENYKLKLNAKDAEISQLKEMNNQNVQQN